jgi:hypothetical protein
MMPIRTPDGPVFPLQIPVVFAFTETAMPQWEIEQRDGESYLRLVRLDEDQPARSFDAWQQREKFLSLKTEPELLAFLNSIGLWTEDPPKRVADYWEWQRVLEHFMTTPSDWSLYQGQFDIGKILRSLWDDDLGLKLWGTEDLPMPHARTAYTLDAILASIRLDLLRDIKFKICARADCTQKIFSVEGRYHKQYCSQYCAHVESQRRVRKGIRRRKKRTTRGRKVKK